LYAYALAALPLGARSIVHVMRPSLLLVTLLGIGLTVWEPQATAPRAAYRGDRSVRLGCQRVQRATIETIGSTARCGFIPVNATSVGEQRTHDRESTT
jgi:hypothetical protein